MDNMARLMITYEGATGDLADLIAFDTPDAAVRAVAQEAVRGGDVAGIPRREDADFTDFVIDRYPATMDLPARLTLRPKTAYGEGR